MNNSRFRVFLTLVVIIILAVLGGGSFLAYKAYQGLSSQIKSTQPQSAVSEAESKNALQTVREMMVLPEDEEPTVAMVKDANQFLNHALLKDAQVGDLVLIFQNSQKMIIYRPSLKKIVAAATIAVNDVKTVADPAQTAGNQPVASPTNQATPTPSAPPSSPTMSPLPTPN